MDLILRRAHPAGAPSGTLMDVGIDDGRIAAMAPVLDANAPGIDLAGALLCPGLVETHIHLDKSCILDRCESRRGDLGEAIEQVARAKQAFTAEDVYTRAARTLEKAILNGTTHMRTHVEVDPTIGLRGLEGIRALQRDYAWAIDVEICVFPQEGLLNNPGTDELLVQGLRDGARVIGAAPYTDSDPRGQMDRIFALAREFDVDIDMHLDFSLDAAHLDLDHVCDLTERFGWAGRVAIGHVSKLSAVPPARLAIAAARLAQAGVALTVLPSTDLYLMGRDADHNVPRGVTRAHELLHAGVNCSLSTNNVLNPFTPFGDCSLIRIANLYANVAQVGRRSDMEECLAMITARPARLMRLQHYGLRVGAAADLVVLDATDAHAAVAEVAQPLRGFKNGRTTFERPRAQLNRPEVR